MLTRSQTLCVTPTTVQKVMQRVWGQFHSVDDILMGIFQVVDCARMRQSAWARIWKRTHEWRKWEEQYLMPKISEGMWVAWHCYDLTPLVFKSEGYACRTRPKLRQPIYCTGSYMVTMWSVTQYSYCGFESWLCSELSAKQYETRYRHVKSWIVQSYSLSHHLGS